MPDRSENIGIGSDLRELLRVIESLSTPFDSELRATRDSLVRTIRNHLLPRVESPGSPLRVVFAGPTGSGKSTMMNAVVGRQVTPSGSIRPTTRLPLVYAKPGFAAYFGGHDIEYEVVTGNASILDDMCLIDTPDIDSTSRDNHRLARDVLETADVVVFVASALRYADLVPWRLLRDIEAGGIPVIHALNRISPSSAGVITDYGRMLRREGMSGPVVRVEEHRLRPGGQVPGASVRNLRRQLLKTVRLRKLEFDAVIDATIADLCVRAERLLDGIDESSGASRALASQAASQLLDVQSMGLTKRIRNWSSLLRVGEGRVVTRRWLRRQALDTAALDRVSIQIRAELIAALEGQIRPLSVEDGRLVIDLRSPSKEQSHVFTSIIDAAINHWFDCIEPPPELHPEIYAYQRASQALEAAEYVFGALGSDPSPSGLTLQRAVAEIARSIESKIITDGNLESEADMTAGRIVLERITRAPVLADA